MTDGRAKNGGARPNSGPKPKADKFESAIAKADKRIATNLVRYIENLEALADGVTVQEFDKDGGERIYTRAPDRQANEYLLNRIMGKPTERHEHKISAEQILRMTDAEFDAFIQEQGIG